MRFTLRDLYAAELDKLTREGQVETVGRLKIHRYEFTAPNGRVWKSAKIWRGRAAKPANNNMFRSSEQREQFIQALIERDREASAQEANRKSEREAERRKMVDAIQVGMILHYSWGYDQTNCDFYQVTEKRGQMVTIRAIASETVPGSEGFMSDRRRPVRDSFLEGRFAETLKKRISPCGLSMEHGIATPCQDDTAFYCSWYA